MKLNKIVITIVIAICIVLIGFGSYKYKKNKEYQETLVEQTRFIKYFKTASSIDGLKISNKDFIDKSIGTKSATENDLKQSHVKGNKYVVVYKLKHKDNKGIHDVEVDSYYYKNSNNAVSYSKNNIVFKQDKKVIDSDWAISIALYNYSRNIKSNINGKSKNIIQSVNNLKSKYKNLDITDLNKINADATIKKDELLIAQEKAKREAEQRALEERRAEQKALAQQQEKKNNLLNTQNNNTSVRNNNSNVKSSQNDNFKDMWIQDQVEANKKWMVEHGETTPEQQQAQIKKDIEEVEKNSGINYNDK